MLDMDVKDVIKQLGGALRVAELTGVSYQAIYKWKNIPPQHVMVIARATGIKPHVLNPVFPEGTPVPKLRHGQTGAKPRNAAVVNG